MHTFVTIPLDKGDPALPSVVRGLVADLFGPDRPRWAGDHWFVRTWDRSDGSECLQISLRPGTAPAGEARERVHRAAGARGLRPTVVEVPPPEVPSPLWNCGVGGPGFDAASKQLCSDISPVLARVAAEVDRGDKAASYLLALRLMVANAAATVPDSDHRRLTPGGVGELLGLRLVSYRSHYEGAKHAQATDPAAFDRRCAAYYDKLGAHVRDLVRTHASSPVPAADDAPARAWVDVVRRHFGTLRDGCRAGAIRHDGPTLDGVAEGSGASLPRSDFHSRMSKEMSDLLHRDPDFVAYRIATSLLYSCLYTVGFGLAERFLFCYLVARANEDVSGRTTEQMSRGLATVARELAER